MGNDFDLAKFNELKNLTKANYESIGNIYCPALKAKIVFSAEGFHHLRYDNNRSERKKSVQQSKFICLNNGVDILKKTNTIQEYRRSLCAIGNREKNGLRDTKIVEWFGFLAIISFVKGVRINVVVRRIGGDNGQYHFWSVMPYWRLTNNKRIIGTKKMEDE